jgi:two-component system response regulator DevR
MVREGVRMILDNDSAMKVVGEAGTIREGCAVAGRTEPDVILLDPNVGGEAAISHLKEVQASSPRSKVLMLTGFLDDEANQRAAECGAMGLVLKIHAAATLLMAIRKVSQGEVWFDRALTAKLIREANTRRTDEREGDVLFSKLTDRELEIAMKIGEGLVNKDIALALGISEKTVRNCLTTIYEKLGVIGRLELALFLTKHHRA